MGCNYHSDLTVERLRYLLTYDRETGLFTRLVTVTNRTKAGSIAGSKTWNGYVIIGIDGVNYQAHRLAWLWVHGRWPVEMIDHINRVRDDNRFENLREADRTLNARNVRSVGYHIDKYGRFRVGITVRHRSIYLGTYSTAEEARAVYLAARVHHFGHL